MSYVPLKDEFGFPLFEEHGGWLLIPVDDNPAPVDDGWTICDLSGVHTKPHDLVRNWDGALVNRRFLDKRNPQDFVRGVRDDQRLPFARPEPEDVFIAPGSVHASDL